MKIIAVEGGNSRLFRRCTPACGQDKEGLFEDAGRTYHRVHDGFYIVHES